MARWISGVIMAVCLVGGLLYLPLKGIQYAVVGLAVMAAWELFSMIFTGESILFKLCVTLLSGVGAWIFLFSEFSGLYYFFYVTVVFAFLSQFKKGDDAAGRVGRVALFVFGVFYVVILFGLMGRIAEQPHARFWLFLTFACTFCADTCAYFVGKGFGKRLLAPHLSPKKTVEGLVGGILGSVVAAVVVRFLFWPTFSVTVVIALGIVLAVVGMLGDLSESLIKRGFQCKDSGVLIPGHGGVLDRVDALLFAAPLVYLISIYL